MKKILKYLLLLLPFLSEAQNFAIPTVTDLATARRNVIKGNASNYVLVMYRDTLRLLGATTMFNVGYSDASSIALRQFNITGGVGVNVSGGSGNLTADRNVTISLPQAVATTSSPSFVGINASGNITAGGNLTVTGTSNFNGNIIYSSSKYQQVQSYASSNNYQTFKWFIDGTGDASSLALETTRRSGSSISVRYPFLVHNGKVRINGLDTSLPTKDFEVLGDVSMQGTVYFPLSYQYPVNTFLKVGTNGELQGYDLNATLDAKLNSSTAASTYAALNSNNLFNGSNTFENPISIKTTNAITGSYSKYVLSNTDFDYTNSGLMFNLSHYEGGAVSGTNVMLLRGNKLKIGNGLDPAYTLDVAGDASISTNLTVGGTFSMTSPFNLGGTSVTTNATRLNYLSAASGTTGTTSSNLVYSNSPTLVTPNLGTPSAVTLTNGTGLPVSTGISGLGSGVATFLATPSSANLLAALTTKTGTGNAVFSADATLTGTTNIATIANTNGANFATSSGNVLISTTTNAGYKLDVNGTFRAVGNSVFNGNLDISGELKNNGNAFLTNNGGITQFGFGAGTATTGLEIGTNRTGNSISYIDLGGETTNLDFGLRFMRDGLTSSIFHAGAGDLRINSINTGSMVFSTDNTERMRINSNGNVLIGTTVDAGYKTDINGTLRTAGSTYLATSSGNIGIGTTSPVAKITVDGDISFTNVTNGLTIGRKIIFNTALGAYNVSNGFGHLIYDYDTGAGRTDLRIAFRQNTTNITGDMVTFAGNGNVGIGTTSPAQTLDVNGIAQATQFKVSALNTAPASASATGITGEIRVTSTHIYVCTATNTWVRAALSTW